MNWKALLLTAVVAAAPAAAKSANQPVVHVYMIYSAYDGDSNGNGRIWSGYVPPPPLVPSYPGTLVIEPGGANWANYVGAAQASVPYTITGVTLDKQTPSLGTCPDVFPARKITQTGTSNIRLNWPLLYEVPGTTWTLTVTYDSQSLWDDDGEGPNQPSLNHTDFWVWQLQADAQHLRSLLSLLHDVPVGTSGVPAISDEALYLSMVTSIEQAEAAYDAGDLALGAEILADLELLVMDSCVSDVPAAPNPTGLSTGVIGSTEHPACCRLLAEIEGSLPGG